MEEYVFMDRLWVGAFIMPIGMGEIRTSLANTSQVKYLHGVEPCSTGTIT
jgi:hypothetical protein